MSYQRGRDKKKPHINTGKAQYKHQLGSSSDDKDNSWETGTKLILRHISNIYHEYHECSILSLS